MSPYELDLQTERRGIELVTPLLASMSSSPILWTSDMDDAKRLQAECGDALICDRSDGTTKYVEIKAEREYKTRNLFIETWSNCDFHRQKQGWIMTSRPNILVYTFIDKRVAFVIDYERLWKWCLLDGNLYAYREVDVEKWKDSFQKNRTRGRCPPVSRLERDIEIETWVFREGYWEKSCVEDFESGTSEGNQLTLFGKIA